LRIKSKKILSLKKLTFSSAFYCMKVVNTHTHTRARMHARTHAHIIQ